MVSRSGRSIPVSVRFILVAVAIAAFTDHVPTQSPPPASYGVLDLGTLGGPASAVHGVDEFAYMIVGEAQTAGGAYHAFVEGLNGRKDLGTLGGSRSVALGANYWVVGRSQIASGQERAFSFEYWRSGATMVNLGTLGGTWSSAYAAEYPSIVGASKTTGDAKVQAFIWSGGSMSPLPTPTWNGDSEARAIAGGIVVGKACSTGNASCRAVRFEGGDAVSLGSLGGNSIAHGINYGEMIVGSSARSDGTTHAFLWQLGTMGDLGTLGGRNSEAFDINESGDVVGTSEISTSSAERRAFLWRNGVMTDLNTLLPAGSGWILRSATGITEGGQIAGTGTLNGVTRAFLLTPPTDLAVRPGGVLSLRDSNRPRGVEAGKEIRFVVSAEALSAPITAYGARLTLTLTGPADYVAIEGYDSSYPKCQVAPKVITCDVPPIDSIGIGREYLITARTTAAGRITHRSEISSPVIDPNGGDNSITEENWAVALAGLTLTPATIPGGKASSAVVTLTDLPPSGDGLVRLASSRPDIAPVPATVGVPYFAQSPSRGFNIVPKAVTQPTPVEITASYGLVTIRQTLTVVPPKLLQLYLTPTTVIGGCGTSAGKVVLTGWAPAGGAVVSLSNTNSMAVVPSTVTVPAGTDRTTFTVATKTVTSNVVGSVTASYGGHSQTLNLTVRPVRVKTLTLSPNPAAGGATVNGTVTLECAAPPGGAVVSLTSTNTSVAAPTVPAITIPAGAVTGSFSVRTSHVAARATATIYGTVYGVRKGATLTVNP